MFCHYPYVYSYITIQHQTVNRPSYALQQRCYVWWSVDQVLGCIARENLVTPGLPAGNYLAHFGMWVFSPRIFDSLEYLIKNDLREKGEFQLTAAQEHLRQNSDKYWVVHTQGQRYDTGIPYGLMETQLALALNGIHRTEICEAIARILAMQVKS